jgi:CHAD domain-containing protein
MAERTVRLAVPVAFALPDLRADPIVAEARAEDPVELLAGYWDTADLRLARHGITLRHRDGDQRGPRWTLVLPEPRRKRAGRARTNGSIRRREIELDGADDRVPALAIDLVTAYVRTAPLTEIAKLRTRRCRWSLVRTDGAVAAVLDDDDVSVLDDGTTISRFREIELDGRAAKRVELDRLATILRSAGAVDAEPIPRAVRAMGPAATAAADAVRPEVGPDRSAAVALRAALTSAVERLVANDPGTRLGDAESLHQARVGVRQLRSHLRTFAGLVEPSWASELDGELRGLARRLGDVRDLDVLVAHLEGAAHDLRPVIDPLFEHLGQRRERARAALLDTLRDERYAALLERVVAAAAGPRLVRAASRPAADLLPPLFTSAWRRLARRAAKLSPEALDAEFHAVRIRAKRARYAAEAIATVLEPARADGAVAIAERLAALQDELGVLQDATVARDEILASAARHPDDGAFNLAAGVLVERETQRAAAARAAGLRAWRDVRRPRLRRWLAA